MGTFSFLSRSDREMIDDTARLSKETDRDVEQIVPSGYKDFPAKLTAYDAGTGFYSWTRRAWNADRTRYDYPTAVQVGTPTSNPARFPNGDVISVSTPVDVWLRPVGISSAVGMVHEVVSTAPTKSGIGSPTDIAYSDVIGVSIRSLTPQIITSVTVTDGPGTYLLFAQAAYYGTITSGQIQVEFQTKLTAGSGTFHPSAGIGLGDNWGGSQLLDPTYGSGDGWIHQLLITATSSATIAFTGYVTSTGGPGSTVFCNSVGGSILKIG